MVRRFGGNIGSALQNDHADALAACNAVGLLVKCAAMSSRRDQPCLTIEHVHGGIEHQVDTCHDGKVDIADF